MTPTRNNNFIYMLPITVIYLVTWLTTCLRILDAISFFFFYFFKLRKKTLNSAYKLTFSLQIKQTYNALVGPIVIRPVQDPLAILRLKNLLCMSFFLFDASYILNEVNYGNNIKSNILTKNTI